jgi:glycosyltransferase involved in cell wall biosynthesis
MNSNAGIIRALVAIPAYNEELLIPGLLNRLESWKKDIIVIDDGSTDRTAEMVRSKGFSCYSHKTNQGLTGFYFTARQYAEERSYTHLISLDGDGQHDPSFLGNFLDALSAYDLVSGNRFHNIDGLAPPKIAANLFAILMFRKYLGINVPDAACGFRALKLELLTQPETASQYGIVYDMLAGNILSGRKAGFVKIPAIYHSHSPMTTRAEEIAGLVSTINHYRQSADLEGIIQSVQYQKSFRISLFDFDFEARSDSNGSYRFVTDTILAEQYFRLLHGSPDI